MRLLVPIDAFSFDPAGGAGTVLWETTRRLVARGHQATVLCRRRQDLSDGQVLEGVEFRTHADGPSPLVLARSLALGRRASRWPGYHAIWAHHALPAWALLGGPAGRLPCVLCFHSPWSEEHVGRGGGRVGAALRRAVEGRVVRAARRRVVLSASMGETLRRVHGVEATDVVPGAADLERFAPVPPPERERLRKKYDLPPDARVILTLRSLVPRMGVEDLVEAMVEVRRRLPTAVLVVAGRGPLLAPLQAKARGLLPDGAVRFPGFIPAADLADRYRAADLFVLPTRELEGFGLVLAEAMACGVPAAGTPVGGIPEVLAPLGPGFVAASRGPAALADLVLGILGRPDFGEELSRRVRRVAEECYSWERVADRVEAILREAVQS